MIIPPPVSPGGGTSFLPQEEHRGRSSPCPNSFLNNDISYRVCPRWFGLYTLSGTPIAQLTDWITTAKRTLEESENMHSCKEIYSRPRQSPWVPSPPSKFYKRHHSRFTLFSLLEQGSQERRRSAPNRADSLILRGMRGFQARRQGVPGRAQSGPSDL